MRLFEQTLFSSRSSTFLPFTLLPLTWTFGIVGISFALLLPGSLQAQIPQKVIATSSDVSNPTDVASADLDGDGDQDVLSASELDDKIAWYENQIGEGGADGDGFGSQQAITGKADEAQSVAVGDLDGDGDQDVLSASGPSVIEGKIAWYENQIGEGGADGDGFGAQQVITTSADGAQSVAVGDLDGDGDLDVLSASRGGDKIAWYENKIGEGGADGDGFGAQQVITTSADGAVSVAVGDLDGDEDLDVLSASLYDDKIAWYENKIGEGGADGDGFGSQQAITGKADGAQSVAVGDLNGDGDQDILSASSEDDKIAWYENTDGVLPVELVELAAHTDDSGAVLSWKTTSETNNAGFQVQRKTRRSGWRKLGYVESKAAGGTTSETQTYRYRVEDLPVGTHQFRLKQVDLDGSSQVHGPISVDVQMQEAIRLTAPAPNPVSSTATLSFAVKEKAGATVAVYDMLGRKATTLFEGRPTPGQSTRLQFDTSGLPSGSYIIRLRADGQTETQRMTVVR